MPGRGAQNERLTGRFRGDRQGETALKLNRERNRQKSEREETIGKRGKSS